MRRQNKRHPPGGGPGGGLEANQVGRLIDTKRTARPVVVVESKFLEDRDHGG